MTNAVGSNPPADGFSFNYGEISGLSTAGAGQDGHGAAEAGMGGTVISAQVDTWENTVNYSVEASSDLDMWTPVTGVVGMPNDNGDGTETVAITDTALLGPGVMRFIRVKVVYN